MKKTKIIIPALGLLVLSTAASVTGTVAWFSANSTVSVTGMKVQTKVSSNLMIAELNENDPIDAQYNTSITQNVKKILEPASTVDGISYFYVASNNVLANGDARSETYLSYSSQTALSGDNATNYLDHFSLNYGISKAGAAAMITGENGAYAYADYSFYLKGTNVETTAQYIKLTRCNLIYGSAVLGSSDRAWRVAVFAQSATKNTAVSTALAAGDRKTILAPASAAYFTAGNAVASTSALGAVTVGSGADQIAQIAAGATAYFKITVRLWLEGEDNTCNNETYAALTDQYSLDLAFEFNTPTAAVTQIGSSLS